MDNTTAASKPPLSVPSIVETLKFNNEDREFYPSTDELISAVRSDIDTNYEHITRPSVLDIGCGDGRVLAGLTEGKRYGIEISKTLLNLLDASIYIVGTDFHEQTLIDKSCDVIFCNAPFLEAMSWAKKIIIQANAPLVYLVLPERWSSDKGISYAIETRKADVKNLGSYSFLNADRRARTNAELIRFDLGQSRYNSKHLNVAPFDCWFDTHFQSDIANDDRSEYQKTMSRADRLTDKVAASLVEGGNIIDVLETLYHQEMQSLLETYKTICNIDSSILSELNVSLNAIKEGLGLRIVNVKNLYWKELFDHYKPVTDRLTHGSRKAILEKLHKHTNVDFSAQNAYAITGWVLKNADDYIESQLISTYEVMIKQTNILNYVSNKRTWKDSDWLYSRKPDNVERISLDHRCIVTFYSAIESKSWGSTEKKLSEQASEYLDDLTTIAASLGYKYHNLSTTETMEWDTGKLNEFLFSENGETKVLFSTRGYYNGNVHVKFNPRFLLSLNLEFGRLRGWLRSSEEAESELDLEVGAAEGVFDSLQKLTHKKNLLSFTI